MSKRASKITLEEREDMLRRDEERRNQIQQQHQEEEEEDVVIAERVEGDDGEGPMQQQQQQPEEEQEERALEEDYCEEQAATEICLDCGAHKSQFKFCPATGEKHEVVVVEVPCGMCGLMPRTAKFCPETGKPHHDVTPAPAQTIHKKKAVHFNQSEVPLSKKPFDKKVFVAPPPIQQLQQQKALHPFQRHQQQQQQQYYYQQQQQQQQGNSRIPPNVPIGPNGLPDVPAANAAAAASLDPLIQMARRRAASRSLPDNFKMPDDGFGIFSPDNPAMVNPSKTDDAWKDALRHEPLPTRVIRLLRKYGIVILLVALLNMKKIMGLYTMVATGDKDETLQKTSFDS
eukprot:PhM_4_TR13364/c3_g1_i1/m.64873